MKRTAAIISLVAVTGVVSMVVIFLATQNTSVFAQSTPGSLPAAGSRGGAGIGSTLSSLWTNTGTTLLNTSGNAVDFDNQKGVNVTLPTLLTDGASKAWLDTEIATLDTRLKVLETPVGP